MNSSKKDLLPREKLMCYGAENLSDTELLAILLRTGTKGKNVLSFAAELLEGFGSLNALMHAPRNQILTTKGLGEATYTQIRAVLELARRCLQEEITEKALLFDHPKKVKHFLRHNLSNQKDEVFAVLFLNNKNRLIRFEKLFRGTINMAPVFPRTVLRRTIDLNAAAVILAHNHPSDDLNPSESDRKTTRNLQQALSYIDVRVVDHIIVGRSTVLSMRESAMLQFR